MVPRKPFRGQQPTRLPKTKTSEQEELISLFASPPSF